MAHLGLRAELIAPGQARVWGTLQPEHLNSFGSAHGGYLYTLADAAFALAANAHGPLAVALSTHMEYMKTVKAGEVVEAKAREVNLGGRTALYHVDVCCGETLLAQFTLLSTNRMAFCWQYVFSASNCAGSTGGNRYPLYPAENTPTTRFAFFE